MSQTVGRRTLFDSRSSVTPKRTWRAFAPILLAVAAMLAAGAGTAGAAVDVGDVAGVTILPVDHSVSGGSVDWRTKGTVTPVKNQGACDAGWAFAITGLVEGYHQISLGTLVSLSEQQLVDCDSFGTACSGGRPVGSLRLMIAGGGLELEKDYPYKGAQGTCGFDAGKVAATIPGAGRVPPGDEESLQAYVAKGPVLAMIDGSHTSFTNYTSGVYYEADCSSWQPTHTVLIVGYDTVGGVDYWIVKNSQGSSWGSGGYILMSRNRNNNCGIASYALAEANLPIRDIGPAIPALGPAALAGLGLLIAATALAALVRRAR